MFKPGSKATIKLLPDELKTDIITIKIVDLIESVEINTIKQLFMKFYELTIEEKNYSFVNDNLNEIMKKCPGIVSEHFRNVLLVI